MTGNQRKCVKLKMRGGTLKKYCKFARDIKTKGSKTNGSQTTHCVFVYPDF